MSALIGVCVEPWSDIGVCQVQEMGWTGVTNGLLLRRAQERFDVFLTGDSNLSFQQNLAGLRIRVIVLKASSMRLIDTLPLMSEVLALLMTIQPGEVLQVGASMP